MRFFSLVFNRHGPGMNSLRRFAYFVFGVACLHLVFGAIVRISGSGMGCGPSTSPIPSTRAKWVTPGPSRGAT